MKKFLFFSLFAIMFAPATPIGAADLNDEIAILGSERRQERRSDRQERRDERRDDRRGDESTDQTQDESTQGNSN